MRFDSSYMSYSDFVFKIPQIESDDITALLNLTSKKPKSKPKAKPKLLVEAEQQQQVQPNSDSSDAAVDSSYITELDPPTYEYSQLLDRIVDILHSKDPAWAEKRRQTLKAPQMMRGE